MIRSVPVRRVEIAQRVVETRLRQHDADVRQCRLGEHARDVPRRKRLLERVDVVPLDDLRGQRQVDRRADVAGARDHPVAVQRRERLVDRAVVAVVEDEDLRTLRDLARQPQCEAVGVGRRERELPRREPEAAGQLLGRAERVLARKHRGGAARRLLGDGRNRRRRRMPGHGTGVAEAEVQVLVAVDVDDTGTGRVTEKERETPGPLRHPTHWHAAEERALSPLEEVPRAWVRVGKAFELARHQRLEPRSIESRCGAHRRRRVHAQESFTATCLMRVYSSME